MSWASWKLLLIEILKWALLLLLIGLLLLQMGQGKQSRTSFEDMTAAVLDGLDLSQMQPADHQMLRRLYGLNPGDYEGCLLYYPTTNMGAAELLLVKLRDPAQQAAVETAVQSRLTAQKTSFDGYGIEQMALLEGSVLELRGGYVLFIVHPEADAVRQAFLDAL